MVEQIGFAVQLHNVAGGKTFGISRSRLAAVIKVEPLHGFLITVQILRRFNGIPANLGLAVRTKVHVILDGVIGCGLYVLPACLHGAVLVKAVIGSVYLTGRVIAV